MELKKMNELLFVIIVLGLITSGCSDRGALNGGAKMSPKNNLLQPIAADQIEKINAVRMDFQQPRDSTINNIPILLHDEQTAQLLNWYNAIPENRLTKVNNISGSMKMGIVLELKNRTTARIQYNSDREIFITVSDPAISKFKIDDPAVRPLLDTLLK